MKTSRIILLVALIAVAGDLPRVAMQDESGSDGARGAFLVSRQRASNRPRRQRPAKAKPIEITAPAAPATVAANSPTPASLKPLSLGYSVYQNQPKGAPVRVSPKHQFVTGDEIKIIAESSEDGYLYVFYQDIDGKPEMIFPQPHVNSGENWIEAHVLYQIPPGNSEDDWFVFDDKPATHRLFLVFSRQPIAGVPDRRELIRYCQSQGDDCTWRPSPPVWEAVQARLALPHRTSRSDVLAFTAEDRETLARGLRPKRQGLVPSVIEANSSERESVLVVATELIQKTQ